MPAINNHSREEIRIRVDPDRMRPNDVPLMQGDNRKFCALTGWKPRISMEKMTGDLLEYWREEVKKMPIGHR